MAEKHGFKSFELDSTTFMSKYQADSEKELRKFFETAEKHRPSLIILDEADAILSTTSQRDNSTSQNCKNLLLKIFDGSYSPKGVTIFLCTNRPWAIDRRQIARFAREFYFVMPSDEEKFIFFQQSVEQIKRTDKCSITKEELLSLNLENFSFRDIFHLLQHSFTAGPHSRTKNSDHFRKLKSGLYRGCNCKQNCSGRTNLKYEDILGEEFQHGAIVLDDLKKVREERHGCVTDIELKKFERFKKGATDVKDDQGDNEEKQLKVERDPESLYGRHSGGDTYNGGCCCCQSIWCLKFWIVVLFIGAAVIGYYFFAGVIASFRRD